jgi:hypothetical protein
MGLFMTFSIMTLKEIQHYGLICGTQHKDTQHKDTQHKDTLHKDTQHKDTQHKDTRHKDTQHKDTQHNGLICTLSIKTQNTIAHKHFFIYIYSLFLVS